MKGTDPVRGELRGRWAALLAGEITPARAASWAQYQLIQESWTDEVTHQGLQLLNDHRTAEPGDLEARASQFRSYWDWMEVVQWFEDDPIAWNRNYALNFVSRLPASMRPRTVASFIKSGMLSEADIVEFRLRS
jgi:hypothetical protein